MRQTHAVGYVDVVGVRFVLPDGRVLLDDVSFRVGEGAKTALVGANGAGKTTLLNIVAGDLDPATGSVQRSGGLGVMRQFIGSVRDASTVADLLLSVAPPRIRAAAAALEAAELAMMETDDEPAQLRYAAALAEWADAGGYDIEVLWDTCCISALGHSLDNTRWREVRTLSGGEQKRLALEALLRGPDEVLLLDEPDNYLDVPAKQWLERQLNDSSKTVLYVSHDRELLANTATRVVSLELQAAGNSVWVHPGGYQTFHDARRSRFDRLEEERRRWDEQQRKLQELVRLTHRRAVVNSDAANAYKAAQTRLRKFNEAGPPENTPREQKVTVRLRGARTGKRAVVCEHLELTGLMAPFDLEVWYGERVGILGSNGSGKSHFLRLLARGGSDPMPGAADPAPITPVAHTGVARLGARVRPGWFAQTHEHPELIGRTLLDILHRGDQRRDGMGREDAARALSRYELAGVSEQPFETLSGGQQARLQILLLELSGATLLLLDEPTDNLDTVSADALESALQRFAGTVLTVTHDRWLARSFDRHIVFGADGRVYESDEPVWDEGRVSR